MDMKDILSKLSQMSEAVEKTATGIKHKAGPGGYGRKFDTDEEGEEKQDAKPAEKRGRGRPKNPENVSAKNTERGKELQGWIVGNVPKKPSKELEKLPSRKHKLKEYFNQIDKQKLDEMLPQQPIPVVGKEGDKTSSQVGFVHVDDTSPAGKAMQDALGNLAQQKKAQIVVPTTQQKPATGAVATGQQPAQGMQQEGILPLEEKWGEPTKVSPEEKGKYKGKSKAELLKSYNALKKSGPHKKGSPEFGRMRELAFAIRAKSGWGKVGEESEGVAEVITKKTPAADIIKDFTKSKNPKFSGDTKAQRIKRALGAYYGMHPEKSKKEEMDEADMPPNDGLASPLTMESKKVNEGMDHKLHAAHHLGKSHALSKQAYSCHYDDMEEAKMYHMGFKEGLDECYGQGIYEEAPPATVGGMADAAASPEMDEGNAFTGKLASTSHGDAFSLGGRTYKDTSTIEEGPFNMYEDAQVKAWDSELSSLLNENLSEGVSISSSTGQQGAPDTVSVTATDGDAGELLSLIKQMGMGAFGDDKGAAGFEAPGAEAGPVAKPGGIEVIGDHDGMMDLIKKVTGGGEEHPSGEDYADEKGEKACEKCGDEECGCGDEEVSEEETVGQQEYQVAEQDEETAQEGEVEESQEEQGEAVADQEQGGEEEDLEESFANAADDEFTASDDFMMNTITSGLNRKKQTGQTTVPVIPGQNPRMGSDGMNESITDWLKLAGIKK